MRYRRLFAGVLLLPLLLFVACRGGENGSVSGEEAWERLGEALALLEERTWTFSLSDPDSVEQAYEAVRVAVDETLAGLDVKAEIEQTTLKTYTITLSMEGNKMMRDLSILAAFEKTTTPGIDSTDALKICSQHELLGEPEGSVLPLYTCSTYRYTVDTPKGQGYTTLGLRSVSALLSAIAPATGAEQRYVVKDSSGAEKTAGEPLASGDVLTVSAGGESVAYTLEIREGAPRGRIEATREALTAGVAQDLHLKLFSGLRGPQMRLTLHVPAAIPVDLSRITLNVIGRGEVRADQLASQSMGKVFDGYDHDAVGKASVETLSDGSHLLVVEGLDLRAENGQDLDVIFHGITLEQGDYPFGFTYESGEVSGRYKPSYETKSLPAYTAPYAYLTLSALPTVTDFARVIEPTRFYDANADLCVAAFTWTSSGTAESATLLYSTDKGETWQEYGKVSGGKAEVSGLEKDREYLFCLEESAGRSNVAGLYTGRLVVTEFGARAGDGVDDAPAINKAIDYLASLGGGTLLFPKGTYNTTTIHLKSHVYLYVDTGAVISALKGMDAPETTWWSDRDYRSGTSATAIGPYSDPCNYLTKQDVGHTYFANAMFTAVREDDIKVVGTGKITGAGNLVTSDKVMDNAADNRADKMFSLKLCTNIEIGGLYTAKDLWYYETSTPNTDEPFYVDPEKAIDKAYIEKALTEKGISIASPTRAQLGAIEGIDTRIDNMLHIERGGHFVLLATGCDTVTTHDTYADKSSGGVRDIFDYMACGDVYAINIYAAGSSDDIVKPGSDVSLGFTRPVAEYKVRNIIGDTNCNLFQIGSETADDIQNIFVDNIYVLAANKAGFSISTNDGAYVKNIFLNCGGTNPGNLEKSFAELGLDGSPDTSRYAKTSQMRRTRTPFFISISNRGRTMGGKASTYTYDNGTGSMVTQLLSDNVAIGRVEGIKINNLEIEEVYGGSRYNKVGGRWETYGTQNRATAIISGYAVPTVFGGTKTPKPLPVLGKDGVISTKAQRQSADIENLSFTNVSFLYKGGNSLADSEAKTPEMAVGKYNVGDLAGDANGSWLPAYGLWFRHVDGLTVTNCALSLEKNDDRYAIVLDDVKNATLTDISMIKGKANHNLVQLRKSSNIKLTDSTYTLLGGTEKTPISFESTSTATVLKLPYGEVLSESVTIVCASHETVVAVSESGLTLLEGTTAELLLPLLSADDGSKQTYALNKNTLRVTAEDGKTTRDYSVTYVKDIRPTKAEGGCVQEILRDMILVTEGATADEIRASLLVPEGVTLTIEGERAIVRFGDDLLTYTIQSKPAKLEYDAADGLLVQGENGNYTKVGITAEKTNTSGTTIDRQFTGPAGAYVEYTVSGLADGYYVLRYGYKLKLTNRTVTDISVNGSKVGEMNHLTTDSAKENLYTYTDFEVGYITGGTATVRFTVTGPTASFMVDYFILIPIK